MTEKRPRKQKLTTVLVVIFVLLGMAKLTQPYVSLLSCFRFGGGSYGAIIPALSLRYDSLGSSCTIQKAIQYKNTRLCSFAKKNHAKCYGKVAAVKKDPRVCDNVPEYPASHYHLDATKECLDVFGSHVNPEEY